MKNKITFLLFVVIARISFAQVTTLPNSIGIGQNTNTAIPFHIKKNGEVARFEGTWPFVSFYDGITMNGYIQGIYPTFEIGTKNNFNLNFFTGNAQRLSIDGTNGMATFSQKINANNGLKLTGPLQAQGESVGAVGMVLVSKGNATPAWEDKRVGFQAGLISEATLPNNTESVFGSFTETLDYSNSFDNASGEYTVPSSGLYVFVLNVPIRSNASGPISNKPCIIRLIRNGITEDSRFLSFDLHQFYLNSIQCTFYTSLNVNDIISFTFFQVSGVDVMVPNYLNGGRTMITCHKVF